MYDEMSSSTIASRRTEALNEEQFNTNYRERFSAEEKFKIVKEHLMTRTPINELCKKYGITPASFYSWHE